MRARFGEELVGPLLIRSGVPFRTRAAWTSLFAPFSMENRLRNPITQDSEKRIRVAFKSLADSTRDSVTFSDPSGLPRTTTAVVPPLRAFMRNPAPSDASMCPA
jgi:hypothetical protein